MSLSSIGNPSHAPGYGRPAPLAPSAAPATSAPTAPASDDAAAVLAGTARLLGLSPDQLAGALKAGTSLHQLAIYTGVPTAAVHDTVADDLRRDAPNDGAELSDDQLDRIAAGIQSANLPALVPATVPEAAPVRFSGYA